MFYSAGSSFLLIELTFSAPGTELTSEAKVAHLHLKAKVLLACIFGKHSPKNTNTTGFYFLCSGQHLCVFLLK